jgi:hypothetical protein
MMLAPQSSPRAADLHCIPPSLAAEHEPPPHYPPRCLPRYLPRRLPRRLPRYLPRCYAASLSRQCSCCPSLPNTAASLPCCWRCSLPLHAAYTGSPSSLGCYLCSPSTAPPYSTAAVPLHPATMLLLCHGSTAAVPCRWRCRLPMLLELVAPPQAAYTAAPRTSLSRFMASGSPCCRRGITPLHAAQHCSLPSMLLASVAALLPMLPTQAARHPSAAIPAALPPCRLHHSSRPSTSSHAATLPRQCSRHPLPPALRAAFPPCCGHAARLPMLPTCSRSSPTCIHCSPPLHAACTAAPRTSLPALQPSTALPTTQRSPSASSYAASRLRQCSRCRSMLALQRRCSLPPTLPTLQPSFTCCSLARLGWRGIKLLSKLPTTAASRRPSDAGSATLLSALRTMQPSHRAAHRTLQSCYT